MSQIKLKFERGGEFIANLIDDEAPRICKQINESLPIESRTVHTTRSGMILHANVPFETRILENPKTVVPMGGLAIDGVLNKTLYRDREQSIIEADLIIAYGVDNMIFGISGLVNPVSYFAQIQDNLDELYNIGRRHRAQGKENILIERI
jgi:hypothetical protein